MSQPILLLLLVFVAAAACLPSRCLATYTYRHKTWWEVFMKCAVEIGSVSMVYLPSFIQRGSGIQIWCSGYTDTQTARPSHGMSLITQSEATERMKKQRKNKLLLENNDKRRICSCIILSATNYGVESRTASKNIQRKLLLAIEMGYWKKCIRRVLQDKSAMR
jgi:hypothetical protein